MKHTVSTQVYNPLPAFTHFFAFTPAVHVMLYMLCVCLCLHTLLMLYNLFCTQIVLDMALIQSLTQLWPRW